MNEHLAQEIRRILSSAKQHVLLAYVFGSVARGRAKPSSDIDLAVLCPELTAEEKIRLWQEISDVAGRPLDWVDLEDAGSAISLEALGGKRLIGSDERHAQLLSRTLIDAEDFGYLHARLLKERRDAWLG